MAAENQKRAAGHHAADLVEEGMIVGMGTGTTAFFAIERLAERVKQGLGIRAVSTSDETTALCRERGIPLTTLDEVDRIDLTIDGADEVDPQLNGIKGGHGALLREKIIAINSRRNVWVVDESKLVDSLVRDTVPLEVIDVGARQLLRKLEDRGHAPSLREEAGRPFRTDQGNLIVDVRPGQGVDARALEREWKTLVGVVECGFFLGIADTVVIGGPEGIRVLAR